MGRVVSDQSTSRRLPLAYVVLAILAVAALPLAAGDMSTRAPIGGGTPESLSGSFVVFDPSVGGDTTFTPGVAGTFCFRTESFTTDWEYVYSVWERFPADWTITNVYLQGTPSCTNGGTWSAFAWVFQTSPYEVRINHSRYQANPTDHCTAYYCFDAIAGTGTPDALISWYWDGDGYNSTPHWPCSSDGYTPSGQSACDQSTQPQAAIPAGVMDPVMLTPATVDASGCAGQPQIHTFNAWNNAGYDMDMDMSYTVIVGGGTCTGPDPIPVVNGTSVPFDVTITPLGAPGDTVECQIVATDPTNPANTDMSMLYKHLVSGVWDPDWTVANTTGAAAVFWQSAAVGTNPAAAGPVAYYVGGLNGAGTVDGALQMYDPDLDTWTQLTPAPNARFGSAAAFIDGRLYVSGGHDAGFIATTDLQVYDPVTGTWDNTTFPDLPAARGGVSGGIGVCHTGVGLCLFQVGGGPDSTFAGTTRETWEFDPATNTWTQLDLRPLGDTPDGIVLGGGVGCMGYIFQGGDYRGYNNFFRLDATAAAGSQWTQLADIPSGAGKMTPGVVCKEDEGAIYFIAGDSLGSWGDMTNAEVYRYDIATDAWSGPIPQTLTTGTLGNAGVYLDEALWTMGGTDGSGAGLLLHETLGFDDCSIPADLWTVKFQSADFVHRGDSIWYDVYFVNDGPTDVVDAHVTDFMPPGLENVSWWCYDGGGAVCGDYTGTGDIDQLVDLAVGTAVYYYIEADVAATASGIIANTATIIVPAGIEDPDPLDNSYTVEMTVLLTADLGIAKDDGVTQVRPGDVVTYTIPVYNNGPDALTGVHVVDILPAALTGTDWTCDPAGGGVCPPDGAGNIDVLVDLPAATFVTFTAWGTVDAAAAGALINTATVAGPPGVTDADPINNTAVDVDEVITVMDLWVTKTDGVDLVMPGATVTYTIVFGNSGPSNATGVAVTDMLPASLTGTDWSCAPTGGGVCPPDGAGNINALVGLPAGTSVTFTAWGVLDPAATGTLVNTASIAPAGFGPEGSEDPNYANNVATDIDNIQPPVDIYVFNETNGCGFLPGDTVTYSIEVGNYGPGAASDIEVTDLFPATLTGVAWTCTGFNGGSCPASGAGNIVQVVGLPVGAWVTFTATGTLDPAATVAVVNTVQAVSPVTGDSDLTNNVATHVDSIVASLAEIIFCDSVESGDTSAWTTTIP